MQLNPAKMARPVHADGRRYVPAIDGLRCLAAWAVISAHIGSQFGPTHHLVAYYGAAAYPALIVFFTISGFLVYRPFARAVLAPHSTPKKDRSTRFWVYILRRVLRIFPLYWTVLAVAVIWNGPGNLHSFTDWVQAIFLLPIPDPMRLLAGPLGIAMWTLAIELPFYVVVPLYAQGVKALHRRVAPDADAFTVQVVAVCSVIAFIFGLGLVFGGELAFPVMSLPVGMLLAILETRQSLDRRRYALIRVLSDNWWLCIAGYVALVFLGAHLALNAYDSNAALQAAAEGRSFDPYAHIRNLYFPLQMGMALLLFIPVAFGTRRSLFVRLMASTPLQMLAPLTYGVYLWHVPLIEHTMAWYGRGFLGFPFIGTKGFGMPTIFLALGLAIVTFVCVELPAGKLRDRVDRWSRGQGGGDEPPRRAPERFDPYDDGDPDVLGEEGDAALLAGVSQDELDELDDEHAEDRAGPRPGWLDQHEDEFDAYDTAVEEVELTEDRPADGAGRAIAAAGPRTSTARARTRPGGGATPTVLATPWCEPIDGFRAICACLAVTGHTFLAASIFPFSGVLHVLGILVALFFAISAFVLYQPFLEADVRRLPRPDAKTFYLRRFLRVYPLFFLAVTTYLIVIPEVRPDNAWAYARLYLCLQIFGRELAGLKGFPAGWYLCNEILFYLLMPVMALAASRWSDKRRLRSPAARLRAHLAIGWGMIFFGPLLRTLLYAAEVPQPTSLPFSHLEFFGFGVVMAAHGVGARMGIEPPSLLRWIRDHTAIAYALVLVPVAALAGIAARWGDGSGLWHDGNIEDKLRFFPYFVAIVLLMTAATLGRPDDPANRFLSSTRFKVLSGLALHIYVWHQLVLSLMNKGFGGLDKVDLGPRVVTGAVLVLCALLGSILVSRLTQPITDWPYERYRATHGRLRGRGAAPAPHRPPRRPRPDPVAVPRG